MMMDKEKNTAVFELHKLRRNMWHLANMLGIIFKMKDKQKMLLFKYYSIAFGEAALQSQGIKLIHESIYKKNFKENYSLTDELIKVFTYSITAK